MRNKSIYCQSQAKNILRERSALGSLSKRNEVDQCLPLQCVCTRAAQLSGCYTLVDAIGGAQFSFAFLLFDVPFVVAHPPVWFARPMLLSYRSAGQCCQRCLTPAEDWKRGQAKISPRKRVPFKQDFTLEWICSPNQDRSFLAWNPPQCHRLAPNPFCQIEN